MFKITYVIEYRISGYSKRGNMMQRSPRDQCDYKVLLNS